MVSEEVKFKADPGSRSPEVRSRCSHCHSHNHAGDSSCCRIPSIKKEESPSPPKALLRIRSLSPSYQTTIPANTMASTSNRAEQLCTLADVASSYRLYVLDDALAEPQELVYDWLRRRLFVCQQHRQGNAFAPVELAHEINVYDLCPSPPDPSMISGGGGVPSFSAFNIANISPYTGPHCLEMDPSCTYLRTCVQEGELWLDPGNLTMEGFAAAEVSNSEHQDSSSSSSRAGGSTGSGSDEEFIAEIDVRSGKMRPRVNVPRATAESVGGGNGGNRGKATATGGGGNRRSRHQPQLPHHHASHTVFAAPGIRFSRRGSSSGMPRLDVANDSVLQAVASGFGVSTIYVTSRNIMLV